MMKFNKLLRQPQFAKLVGKQFSYLPILLLSTVLRFYNLGGPSLWYDEAYTWWVATQVSVGESLASSIAEIIPPGTYFLWRGWAALTGETEFALRALAALLGVVAVAAAGRVVWRLTRSHVGALMALTLFTIAPPLLWASREVRMYGPLITFSLLADMALLEALLGATQYRRRWAWLWGLTTLLALYSLVLAGFWLIGQAMFAAIVIYQEARNKKQEAKQRPFLSCIRHPASYFLLPATLVAVLYAPWALAALGSLGTNCGYWPGHLPLSAFLRTTFQAITVFSFITPEQTALALTGGILLVGTVALIVTRRQPLAGLYPLCYTLLPLAVLGYVYRNIPKWDLRHGTLFAPALYLALALAWGSAHRLPQRRWQRGALGALGILTGLICVPLVIADANLLTDPAFTREDWRSAAQYVQQHRQPDDVIIIESGSIFPTWAYYAGLNGVLPLPDDVLLNVEHVLTYADTVPILNAHLQNAETVWLVQWIRDVTDPGDLVATLLSDISEEIPTPAFHKLTVRHFALTDTPNFPAEPATSAQPNTELLPSLHLWGYALPGTIAADEAANAGIHLRTWWMTDVPDMHAGKFYQASFRLMDAWGHTWAQVDEPPGTGDYRPEWWPSRTRILGRFDLQLPPGVPAGTYTATLTLYDDAATSTHTLGTVRVTRPATPPAIPETLEPIHDQPEDVPIQLLAARILEPAIRPCQSLEGELFWEVQSELEAAPTLTVTLGEHNHHQSLTPDFNPVDWRAGDRFLTRFVWPTDCRMPDSAGPLHIALGEAQWEGPTASVSFGRLTAIPDAAQALPDAVRTTLASLAGYQLDEAQAGQPFTLTLYWKSNTVTGTPYSAFVHVTPPETLGPVITQHDAWPAQGARPTYTWRSDEIVADAHPLPALPAGTYRLRMGLYGPDGARLPVTFNEQAVPNDIMTLPFILDVK